MTNEDTMLKLEDDLQDESVKTRILEREIAIMFKFESEEQLKFRIHYEQSKQHLLETFKQIFVKDRK